MVSPKRSAPEPPRHAALIAELCRALEEAEEPPSLDQLAARAGLSPFYLQRLFKRATGVSPKQYAAARRAERARRELTERPTVTEALYEAGFSGSGRFYEQSTRLFGMTPGQYRAGGEAQTIRFAVGECSLGSVLVGATERGVCAVFLDDDPEALVHELERRFPKAELVGAEPTFEELVARVVGLIEDPGADVDLPLDIRGTAFQHRVWEALTRIPPGQTTTYAEVARAIGQPTSSRAVAQACAKNPVAVAIPCHRVVRTDGGLSGYRWGVDRKRALLAKERSLEARSTKERARDGG